MVLSDNAATMSRTDEVHRITENVYKVRQADPASFIRRGTPAAPHTDVTFQDRRQAEMDLVLTRAHCGLLVLLLTM